MTNTGQFVGEFLHSHERFWYNIYALTSEPRPSLPRFYLKGSKIKSG